MGYMLNGQWTVEKRLSANQEGRFTRSESVFRFEGLNHPSQPHFTTEPNRYHLYISYACPWACRVLAVLFLKGLEDILSFSVVDPLMGEKGWSFSENFPDHLGHRSLLQDLYRDARPDYTGRVTVPVLWDKKTQSIVSNESSEIMRCLNRDFNLYSSSLLDLYPSFLAEEIDLMNDRIYESINNGVYKCGFAHTQKAYHDAVDPLFDTLDELEVHLQGRQWLVGDQFTESDLRLFVTLIRFDPVYYSHFKCSRKRLVDYPNLWRHTREVYHLPGIAQTVKVDQIKQHYFGSHPQLNPSGIVPVGPNLDYTL